MTRIVQTISIQKKRLIALLALAIVLAVVAPLLVNNRKNEAVVINNSDVITESLELPDESLENAKSYQWNGLNNEPKTLKIPKISTETYLQKMGNDQNNRIAVPTNVHLGGWYANSVIPGSDGISVIVGHVTGREGDGVFKKIADLNKGDELSVTLGDGTEVFYSVESTITVKENEAISYVLSAQPGIAKQLSLVTCGGNFNTETNQYDDRVVVYARQRNT